MLLRRYHEQASRAQTKTTNPNLDELQIKELKALAKEKGVDGYTKMDRDELLNALREPAE